ncbi:MAG: small, acid-soluble spore protein, alpha/beta type [Syntrophomonadaceae bacterium]|nr:small, acid-soluble spore protein, alpha/beta type [Syntrophomonadaceae bacterium]
MIAAKNKKSKVLTEKDRLKIEIAKELGIWEQVQNEGWESLSNAVCGKVGGLMSKRLRNGKP